MLSILGSLLGFAGSAVPAITDSFARKADHKHEIEKMKVMAELKASGYDHEMKMYEQQGADKEHDRLIQHDISINKGTGIIAGLQKSVRPVITYAFFGLFATIEITLLMEALDKGTEVPTGTGGLLGSSFDKDPTGYTERKLKEAAKTGIFKGF